MPGIGAVGGCDPRPGVAGSDDILPQAQDSIPDHSLRLPATNRRVFLPKKEIIGDFFCSLNWLTTVSQRCQDKESAGKRTSATTHQEPHRLWLPAPSACRSLRGSLTALASMQQREGTSVCALLPYKGRADMALWLRPRSSLLHPVHQPAELCWLPASFSQA